MDRMMDRDTLARVVGREGGRALADPAHCGDAIDAILTAADEYAAWVYDEIAKLGHGR